MVQYMLDACIIQPSKSSFLALTVMIRRKDNSWKMCLDHRDVNKITTKDINSIFKILMIYVTKSS